jgi:uncharacterized C2H2 Zn-finger protein
MRLDVRTVKRNGVEVLDCPLCHGRTFREGRDLKAHLVRFHQTRVNWRHAENQTGDPESDPEGSAQDSPEGEGTA